jgi:hypothetical protein
VQLVDLEAVPPAERHQGLGLVSDRPVVAKRCRTTSTVDPHPARIVSERLGHASVAFTLDVYAHALPGQQATAAHAVASLVDGP